MISVKSTKQGQVLFQIIPVGHRARYFQNNSIRHRPSWICGYNLRIVRSDLHRVRHNFFHLCFFVASPQKSLDGFKWRVEGFGGGR